MSQLLQVVNSPWAIIPSNLEEIRDIYFTHLRGDKIDIDAIGIQIGKPLKNERQGFEVIDGTAIIQVHGVMAKRANLFMDISGGVSTEIIGQEFDQALASEDVERIILDIDSPGGSVDGIDALSQKIFSARGVKPIAAFANGTMASAAYYVGSAADSIFMLDSLTRVGSIGVVSTITDKSAQNKAKGVVVHEIVAGKFKRIVSDSQPLTEEGREFIQAKVDHMYSVFVERVSQYRGVSVQTVLDEMAEGDLFIGQQAIDAGLVDGVSTIESLIQGVAMPVRESNIQTIETEVKTMSDKITRGYILENHADIADEFIAEGKKSVDVAAVQEDAAKTERERIQSVRAVSIPGHEELIDQLAFDGVTTGAEAAVQVIQAEQNGRVKRLADYRDDAPKPVDHAEAANKLEPKTQQERWDADSDLQAEFSNDFDSFVAYEAALGSGQAQILGGK